MDFPHKATHCWWLSVSLSDCNSLTLGGMSSSLSQAVLSRSLSLSRSSLPVMRSGGPGVSEVGSEFCRGISGLGEPALTPSLRAEPVWSCRDWEPDMELEWVFTGTRWAIYTREREKERGKDKGNESGWCIGSRKEKNIGKRETVGWKKIKRGWRMKERRHK